MTTRTLVLLRHAKAANPEGVADTDRPLTPRGHADSAAAGAWLSHRGFGPDLVVCSPSRRTRETWHGVALAMATGAQVRYEDEAYGASARDLLDLVVHADRGVSTLLLIGHNPAMSQLSALLDPAGVDPDGLRTCGLAVHTFTGPWDVLGPRKARLTATHTARA